MEVAAESQERAEGRLVLRDAGEADLPLVARFVRALAEYEELAHEAVATEAEFRRFLLGEPRRAEALIAEADGARADGVVGARLERALHRLLRLPRRRAAPGLDCATLDRRRAGRARPRTGMTPWPNRHSTS